MKTNIITTAVCIALAISTKAQSPAKAVYFEIGGPGVASLNYDMRFGKSESGLGARAGIGGFSLGPSDNRFTPIFIPIEVNYIKSKNDRNYFELGGGITPVIVNESISSTENERLRSTFGHLTIGYRLQPKEGGFFSGLLLLPFLIKTFSGLTTVVYRWDINFKKSYYQPLNLIT